MILVNSLDKVLANTAPPNHYGIPYVWPMVQENKSSMTKGFAIFLDSRLVTTRRDMLRDTVYHELCHAKLWMEDCPEEDSDGTMFLKTCDDVAKYLNTIHTTVSNSSATILVKESRSYPNSSIKRKFRQSLREVMQTLQICITDDVMTERIRSDEEVFESEAIPIVKDVGLDVSEVAIDLMPNQNSQKCCRNSEKI